MNAMYDDKTIELLQELDHIKGEINRLNKFDRFPITFQQLKGDVKNPHSSILSHILQYYERNIVESTIDFLKEQFDITTTAIIHDGIILKGKNTKVDFNKLNQNISLRYNMDVKWAVEELECSYKPDIQDFGKIEPIIYEVLNDLCPDTCARLFLSHNDNFIKKDDSLYLYDESKCLWGKNTPTVNRAYIIMEMRKLRNMYKVKITDERNKDCLSRFSKALQQHTFQKQLVECVEGHLCNTDINFNGHPLLLPLLDNKVLELGDLIVRDRVKKDYFTITLKVNYLGEMHTDFTHIDKFMDTLTNYDVLLKRMMTEYTASGFLGLNYKHVIVETNGGDNGKSAANDVRKSIFGDFYTSVDNDIVVNRPNASSGSAKPQLARLVGKRMGVSCEVGENETLNDSIIKAITGGDDLAFRDLFQKASETSTTDFKFLTLIIQLNQLPEIKIHQKALINRLVVVRFPSIFKRKADYDRELKLRKGVAGNLYLADEDFVNSLCTTYRDECFTYFIKVAPTVIKNKGFFIPDSVRTENDKFVRDCDPYALFYKDVYEITRNENDFACKADLKYAFNEYCKDNQISMLKPKQFNQDLICRGINVDDIIRKRFGGRASNPVCCYKGLRKIEEVGVIKDDYVECDEI
eukprot:Awhi_evm4s5220